ncbi:Uncharacterized protein BM_BM17405 [Brugia malayi]|uniref:Uncharacterized protein n=1 Tax=Brugia malayi TaxID=6279 RepID=A0A4E9F829_BRUMA|nr:Uncharacterized protein BM_BM17405 [Brugia malayi]VIO92196.1 Uncharacterized protein BM_BM17405 [Brugia malayi]
MYKPDETLCKKCSRWLCVMTGFDTNHPVKLRFESAALKLAVNEGGKQQKKERNNDNDQAANESTDRPTDRPTDRVIQMKSMEKT